MATNNNTNTDYLSKFYSSLGNIAGKGFKSAVSLGNTIAGAVGKEKEYQDFIGDIMAVGELQTNTSSDNPLSVNYKLARERDNKALDVYQYGYLLPTEEYHELLKSEGYTQVEPEGDKPYGLVTKAVGDKKVPIFQEHSDDIERNKVVPIMNMNFTREMVADDPSNFSVGLKRARNYPSTIFVDPSTGEVYYQGWDYHNYGLDTNQNQNTKGSTANEYNYMNTFLSSALDVAGNPLVRKSGIRYLDDKDFNFILTNMSAAQLDELSNNNKINENYKTSIEDKKKSKEDELYEKYLSQYRNSDEYINKLQTMDEEDLENELKTQYPQSNLKQYITEMQNNGDKTVESLPWL